MQQKIKSIISFLNDIERLKSVMLHSWTSTGRPESVPEHCWRMAIMAMVFKDEFPEVNILKVMEMCLVHDFGEVYDGDTPGFLKNAEHEKAEAEAVKKVVAPLPENLQYKIIAFNKEFEDGVTEEAKLAQAIDKLEVLIQHNQPDISTWIQLEYELNLTHGQEYHHYHDFIKIFREVIDQMTRDKISKGI